MIASQKIGKSFMGALGYNLEKLFHPDINQRAELLDTNFTSLDKNQIKNEVDLLRSLKPELNRYVYHTSLNFSKEEADQLDNEKLLAIAHDYLRGMGFTGNQFLIFRHYDAEHPHLHVLANRISFNGSVVTDGNNYKRSEALVRKLEKQYNLRSTDQVIDKSPDQKINQSTNQTIKLSQRAPTWAELAMIERTGKASNKMLLQALLGDLLKQRCRDLNELISRGEKAGISFLFNNSASTGRVSGITYFYQDFKATGKALGNSFKWGEISKHISYEYSRDSAAISQANGRTRAKYGEFGAAGISTNGQSADRGRGRSVGLPANPAPDLRNEYQQSESSVRTETNSGNDLTENKPGRERPLETNQDAAVYDYPSFDYQYDRVDYSNDIEISDDIDDEAILGRNRHRKKQARTNRR